MTQQNHRATGLVLAVASAACYALSGVFAASLLEAGWSSGAVTTVRILGAALVLVVPAVLMLRGDWALAWRARWQILIFGTFAVAICQLAFFSAVQYISPTLALLIEFLGPVLLFLFTWARTRRTPAVLTLIGAAVAVTGLVLISGVGGSALHPLGIALALASAVGNAVYWASAASPTHGLHPITLAGFGLLVGGVLLGAVSLSGLLPFRIGSDTGSLAGVVLPSWAIVLLMVLISTVAAYSLGIAAARKLGATLASFAGYAEPLFGIAWTALLLAILPTPVQGIGAVGIIAGVVLVKLGQMRTPALPDSPPAMSPANPHP